MTREIEYRGQDKDNNWVHGDLIHGVNAKKGNLYILPLERNLAYAPNCDTLDGVKIENKTIGQFTGLRDKNGVKIYEGDILKIKETQFQIGGLHQVAFYEDRYITYSILYNDIDQANKHPLAYQIEYADAHVIGNIYDNPELLNN